MNDQSKKSLDQQSSDVEKLSRTQIESALGGQSRRSRRKTKKKEKLDTALAMSPRRQQVLGGDLTGVANRPKSLLNRFSDVSVVNWLVGIIVLAIVTAFFWPQNRPTTRESDAAQAIGNLDRIETDTQSIAEVENDLLSSSTSFSRNDDIDRANDYRELDAKELQTRKLIERAEQYVAEGKYTEPPQNNAVSAYKAALTIDPRNVDARQGLDYIAGRFLDTGFSALQRDDESGANTALNKLAKIDPESSQVFELSAAIETWNSQRKIAQVLTQAESALTEEKFILPAKDNALYFYQQALQLDEENESALLGVQRIADNFIQQANESIVAGEYEAARAHIATVSIIDPDHPSITLVETLMRKAEQQANRAPKRDRNETASAAQQATPLTVNRTKPPAQRPTETPSTGSSSTNQTGASTRTPKSQSAEQQTVDIQYLKQGLDAYYKGDYDLAANLLQPLADKGIARAQFRLAYMHYLGRGFRRDRQEADRIIRAALPAIRQFAEEGRAWAQSDLGSLYEDGLVLARNYAEAIYWYRSAAEQGYPGAQTNLGIMYARGRGVSSSRKTAIEWFQRAAKQGDIAAQRNLEAMGVN